MKIDKLTLALWSVLLMLSCSTIGSHPPPPPPPTDEQLVRSYISSMLPIRERTLFFSLCDDLNIRPALGAALGWHESNLKGYLVSERPNKDGSIDRGWFQLNSGETDRFRKMFWDGRTFDPFDSRENMITGLGYLRNRIDIAGGDIMMGLRLYNAGPGALKKSSVAGIDYARAVLGIEDEILDAARLSYYEDQLR